ncbi:hypothetical protein GcM1_212008 [Golovinomyces cichoracearum]|uniref:Uncharacterized protein n=1 Tax=Golovinomyces cichoracearum TaxID=62708 RepID=A0A420IUP0_9PEZI|nr:hypothetical protein GcM1_212008 [Golovinomyces cichoracearum]
MTQQYDLGLLSCEDRITFPIKLIKSDATISQRRAGMTLKRGLHHDRSRLLRFKEEALVKRVRDLGAKGLAPNLNDIRDMASQLLAARQGGRAGINWYTD